LALAAKINATTTKKNTLNIFFFFWIR
jgi:hypothetical protein